MDELVRVIKWKDQTLDNWSAWAEQSRSPYEPMINIQPDDFDWLDDPMFVPNSRLTWRENYQGYLQSKRWARIRGIAIYEAQNRCQRCGLQSDHTGRGLEVHHKTYKHLYDEPLEDLEVLCKPCHEIADREREAATARRLRRK